MTRIGFLLALIWVVGFVALLLIAFSRWVFDNEEPAGGLTRRELFFGRVFVAAFWWLMLLSEGGRRGLVYLIEGEDHDHP